MHALRGAVFASFPPARASVGSLRALLLPRADSALNPSQVESGKTLACRAQPRSDVTLTWLGRGGARQQDRYGASRCRHHLDQARLAVDGARMDYLFSSASH